MEYILHIVIMLNIYILLVLSASLPIGMANLLTMCQAAFYGVGAYISAYFLMQFDLPFLVVAAIVMISTGFLSVIISFASIKLKDDYFVLASLGFQMIIYTILYNWIDVTRGPYGIPGIPSFELIGLDLFSDNNIDIFILLGIVICILLYQLFRFIRYYRKLCNTFSVIKFKYFSITTYFKSLYKHQANREYNVKGRFFIKKILTKSFNESFLIYSSLWRVKYISTILYLIYLIFTISIYFFVTNYALCKYFTLTTIIIIAIIVLFRTITNSPYGRMLKAIRNDEHAVSAMGRNPIGFKSWAFFLSAAFSGLAGLIYASYVSYIDPTSFTLDESIFIISALFIGGIGNTKGPVLGAIFVVVLPELLRFVGMPDSIAANMRQIIYGLALVLVMYFRPQGLWGETELK